MKKLGHYITQLGNRAAVIIDGFLFESISDLLRNEVQDVKGIECFKFGGECTEKEIEGFMNILKDNPVILSVDSDEALEAAIMSDDKVVITLYGDVINIVEIIDRLQAAGKTVFVNIDLIYGFAAKTSVIDFIEKYTNAGIIVSQKSQLLRYAKDKGFVTVHRFFVVDSHAYRSIGKQLKISHADYINIAPAWSQAVKWAVDEFDTKVIASGLITSMEAVNANLEAGAVAVCTTNRDVWRRIDEKN